MQAAQLGLFTAQTSGYPQSRLNALQNLTHIQEATGHFQEAIQNYKAYETLKDSLFSVEKNVRIARIQTQYDVTTKEATIQLLHKNVQIHQQQLQAVNQQRLLFGLGTTFLFLFLAATGYFLHQARSTQQQLVTKNQEIERQAAQLKEANTLKDRLFSIIGHDLRGPVASLQASFTQLKLKDSQPKDIDKLDQEVGRLAYTLNNLLYWSLTQRQGVWHPQQVDLADLVCEALEGFNGLIRQKNLQVSFEEMQTMMRLDEDLTMLVLRNILHNAIKFTPSGGAIQLSIRQEPTATHLYLTDTGVGMNLNSPQQNRLKGQGTGLGLVLSQELMKQMGGDLGLASQLGQGTTVTLSWPADEPQPEALRHN